MGLYLLSSLRAMSLLEGDDFHASSRVSPDLSLRKIRAYSSLRLSYVLKKLFDKFFPFSFSFLFKKVLEKEVYSSDPLLMVLKWLGIKNVMGCQFIVPFENKLSRSHVIWSHPPYHISLFRATINFKVNLGFVAWCIYLPYWALPTSINIKESLRLKFCILEFHDQKSALNNYNCNYDLW